MFCFGSEGWRRRREGKRERVSRDFVLLSVLSLARRRDTLLAFFFFPLTLILLDARSSFDAARVFPF